MVLVDSVVKETPLLCKTRRERVFDLRIRLSMKESWRCTCKFNPGTGKRAHAALNDKRHDPKCKLTPALFGEERWDGKNLIPPFTKEDLQFLADGPDKHGKSSF